MKIGFSLSIIGGWKLSGALTAGQISCLVIFAVACLAFIISFGLTIFYKSTLKNFCLALSEAEKISRNGLQHRLRRLAEIMRLNPNDTTKKNLRMWEMEYKVLIERKYCEQLKNIHSFFIDPYWNRPTIVNYRMAKHSLRELQIISQEIYLIWQEVDRVFAWEQIERNTRIKLRTLYNDLKSQAKLTLKEGQFDFDQRLFDNATSQINRALNLIEQKIYEGNYPIAETFLTKTSQEIQNFIEMIDLFIIADKLLTETYPKTLQRLDIESGTSANYDADKIKQKQELRLLKNTFENYRRQILESLKNFNYLEASQKLILVNQLFEQFEQKSVQEKQLRSFLIQNLYLLNNFVASLGQEWGFYAQYLNSLEPKNANDFEKEAQLKDLKIKIDYYSIQWNDFYNVINLYLNQNNANSETLIARLLGLLNDLAFLYNKLIEITRNLKIDLSSKTKTATEFLTLEAILSSVQVLIEQYPAFDFSLTKQAAHELRNRSHELESLLRQNDENQDFTKQQAVAREHLNELILEALNLKNNLKNKIMLQMLAENSIIYLERFSDRPKFDEISSEIWSLYENQKFSEALNLTITQLQQFSLQKGDQWNIS